MNQSDLPTLVPGGEAREVLLAALGWEEALISYQRKSYHYQRDDLAFLKNHQLPEKK